MCGDGHWCNNAPRAKLWTEPRMSTLQYLTQDQVDQVRSISRYFRYSDLNPSFIATGENLCSLNPSGPYKTIRYAGTLLFPDFFLLRKRRNFYPAPNNYWTTSTSTTIRLCVSMFSRIGIYFEYLTDEIYNRRRWSRWRWLFSNLWG